ncbi:MAG: hypothetical protein LIQ26_05620 [Bacteroidota bacterium]|nr:hypothetical protein [Bacteroidota bacterium]
MKKLIALFLIAFSLPLAAQAQDISEPDYYTKNLRFEAGLYGGTGVDDFAGKLQLTRTNNFWGPFAYRTGILAMGNGLGYDGYVGVPLSLSYCPGTTSLRDRLIWAAEESIVDLIIDVITGNTDKIGEDIAANLIAVLFARTEFFVGVTPGYWLGEKASFNYGHPRFSLTADAGMVLSIPLGRLSFDITPTYHYSFGKNLVTDDGPQRHFFSVGLGLSWLF